MNETIHFYYNPMSRARMVHWALEESGLAYEIKLLNLEKKEHKTPKFLAINPMGKVPTIVHRGTAITEAAAILTYLGDLKTETPLAPTLEDPRRGSYLRWMFFIATCFEAAVFEKNHPRKEVVNPGRLGFGSYEDTMNTIETSLKPGSYLLGDQFTYADLLLAGQLGWSMMMKLVEPRPVFIEYTERCHSRPASIKINDYASAAAAKMTLK